MGDRWTAAGFVAAYLAIRCIDVILPGGHHWAPMDRWLKRNKDEETPDDT